ncbi:cytochrome P450 [Dactylosporangium salmoneum]|uniref:Cytochrome P450 n=1 Tax=Dactylosporangium salmoneum TaxID=53361 RepID=A0ABP5SZK8_9ACTN
MTTAEQEHVDLNDLDMFVQGRQYPALAWLRRHDPVHWHPAADGGFWVLTRYDDVVRAYRDHVGLSSAHGAVLGGSFRTDGDTAAGLMLVASDVPRHRLLRQLLHPLFAPAPVERVRAAVDERVDAALDRLVAAGGGDFAADVAVQLPVGALSALAGLDRAAATELIGMTRRMVGYRDPALVDTGGDERTRLAWLQTEILEFFHDRLPARSRPPGDEQHLLDVLRSGELNGRSPSEAEILYNALNVAVGGNETSAHTASAGVEALMRHPDQDARLRADPGLLDRAVEEILRWTSTNAYVRRVATRDLELGARTVRAGDSVTLWNAAANRDETQFHAPDTFDVTRSPNRHLSFGSGIHRCIGVGAGTAELRTLFAKLIERRVRLVPAGPVARLRSNFILGVNQLPVEVIGAP